MLRNQVEWGHVFIISMYISQNSPTKSFHCLSKQGFYVKLAYPDGLLALPCYKESNTPVELVPVPGCADAPEKQAYTMGVYPAYTQVGKHDGLK